MADDNQRPDGLVHTMRSALVVERAPVGLGDWSFASAVRRARELDVGDAPLRERLHRDLPSLRRLMGAISIEAANEAMLATFGAVTKDELVARLPDLVTKDSVALWAELLAVIVDGGQRIELVGGLSRLDGGVTRVALGVMVPDDDPELAIVTLTDLERFDAGDVSELEQRRHAEELERTSFENDRLLYAVSHDLRAPLRGVANLAAWIQEDLAEGKEEEVRQHVATLQGRVARMDDMLGAMLDYAKVGQQELTLESVDVGALLEEIAADPDLVPASFALTWEPMPTLVTASNLLKGVLVGLIDNAVKHHDREAGKVTVSAEDGGQHWTFRVADDGPGIPGRYRQRVFHLFSTLRRRDEIEASGMGLAIIQKIVVSQGGRIAIEDVEPRGTAFVFTWPKMGRAEPSDDPPPSVRPGRLT